MFIQLLLLSLSFSSTYLYAQDVEVETDFESLNTKTYKTNLGLKAIELKKRALYLDDNTGERKDALESTDTIRRLSNVTGAAGIFIGSAGVAAKLGIITEAAASTAYQMGVISAPSNYYSLKTFSNINGKNQIENIAIRNNINLALIEAKKENDGPIISESKDKQYQLNYNFKLDGDKTYNLQLVGQEIPELVSSASKYFNDMKNQISRDVEEYINSEDYPGYSFLNFNKQIGVELRYLEAKLHSELLRVESEMLENIAKSKLPSSFKPELPKKSDDRAMLIKAIAHVNLGMQLMEDPEFRKNLNTDEDNIISNSYRKTVLVGKMNGKVKEVEETNKYGQTVKRYKIAE